MWWRLGVLAAAMAGLIALLFWPIPAVDIRVDLPAARPGAGLEPEAVGAAFDTMLFWGPVVVVAAILLAALWIGRASSGSTVARAELPPKFSSDPH